MKYFDKKTVIIAAVVAPCVLCAYWLKMRISRNNIYKVLKFD